MKMKKVPRVEIVLIVTLSIFPVFAAADPPVEAFGLDHQPLGQAQLSLDPSDHLIVSNIGSSGEDGVHVDIGPLIPPPILAQDPFFLYCWEGPTAPPLVGDLLTTSAIGTIGAVPGTLFSQDTLAIPDGGGGVKFEFNPDFSPLGATTHSVELFLDGNLVFFQAGLSGAGPNASAPPNKLIVGFHAGEPTVELRYPATPLPVTIPGGPTILSDGIRFRPDDATLQADIFDGAAVEAGDIPKFTITDEAIGLWRYPHRKLGEAQMKGGYDTLIVSNIGSSGNDGVSIDIGEAINNIGSSGLDGVRAPMDPVDMSLPGSILQIESFGDTPGAPDVSLGWASIENNAGQLQLFGTFVPLDATAVRVQIIDGSAVVFDQILPDGLLGTLAPGAEPSGGGTLTVSNIGSSGEDGVAIEIPFEDGLTFIPVPSPGPPAPGAAGLSGDPPGFLGSVLRLTPVDHSIDVLGLQTMDVTGAEINDLHVWTPEPATIGLLFVGGLSLLRRRRRQPIG